MYKQKKFFGLLALLLMGCGSMVAQSKPERGAEVKAAMGRMLMVAATAEQLTDIAQLEGVVSRDRSHTPTRCRAVSMPYR